MGFLEGFWVEGALISTWLVSLIFAPGSGRYENIKKAFISILLTACLLYFVSLLLLSYTQTS